ncbi:hypothetical protein I7I50_05035 [Histoplasma capsulatum G186AR]|uniref:Uncharacterized protein n=1 Tax=Ajellomyces capsulatus TaxID=5037 RepID=A0A8H8D7G2_AJECA|nr:hypothetical protein I7I52_03293 [Histoplasma capsulatum]QSS75779.1 hypothetical protein I7I50_05035 [Histoplasma capsulatum G186AR]
MWRVEFIHAVSFFIKPMFPRMGEPLRASLKCFNLLKFTIWAKRKKKKEKEKKFIFHYGSWVNYLRDCSPEEVIYPVAQSSRVCVPDQLLSSS